MGGLCLELITNKNTGKVYADESNILQTQLYF